VDVPCHFNPGLHNPAPASFWIVTKPVPSAGRLWPVVVHVLAPTGDEAEAELLLFDDTNGVPRFVRACLTSEIVSTFIARSGARTAITRGAALIVLSIDPRRVQAKYRSRGYRFALIEVGAVLQTIHLRAAELGLPVRAVGGFRDQDLARLVDGTGRLLPVLTVVTKAVGYP
jgi:SagB-type dehydrogenase family enzyme